MVLIHPWLPTHEQYQQLVARAEQNKMEEVRSNPGWQQVKELAHTKYLKIMHDDAQRHVYRGMNNNNRRAGQVGLAGLAWDRISCVRSPSISVAHDQELQFYCLEDFLTKFPAWQQQLLTFEQDYCQRDALTCLVDALCTSVVVLYIPGGTLQDPFWLSWDSLQYSLQFGMQIEKLIVVADKAARATIYESWNKVFQDSCNMACMNSGYIAGAGAGNRVDDRIGDCSRVRSITFLLDEAAELTWITEAPRYCQRPFFQTYAVVEKKSSQFFLGHLAGNSLIAEQRFYLIMQEEYARVQVESRYLLRGTQRYVITNVQEHVQPKAISSVTIKGVTSDSSHMACQADARIMPDAVQAEVYQEHKNIFLGSQATCCSLPSLTATPQQVRCKHGSALGELDPDQVLYMRSRGCSEKQAEQVLLQAFLGDGFEQVDQRVQEKIREAVVYQIHQYRKRE